ncbi:hypothetical protein EYF80_037971 [Liparis tanakae]|uniref:Uncharacterized protein n=1 Tax=Liparis tanakae TaxID=230148 RepID=A0A4Z2GFX7_9TELE|nr:hypothetical protein EYF80_037971 [Liparis tanakae]
MGCRDRGHENQNIHRVSDAGRRGKTTRLRATRQEASALHRRFKRQHRCGVLNCCTSMGYVSELHIVSGLLASSLPRDEGLSRSQKGSSTGGLRAQINRVDIYDRRGQEAPTDADDTNTQLGMHT